MKKAFFGLKPIYQIVILDLLGGIIISVILRSRILTSSKVSLSIIIGVVIGTVIIAIYQKSTGTQQVNLMENMDAQFEKYFIALKELADHADDETTAHCAALEEKIAVLESNIADFPLTLARGYEIYSIVRQSLKPFYDSYWIVSGTYDNQLFACYISRYDTEAVKNLITLVKNTSCPDDIWALDQYDEIYPEEAESA